MHLQVFCVDSHRSSPTASNTFKIARKRLPKKLRSKISSGTKMHLRKNKGDMKRAKSAIQSHVWESRDSDWIPLEVNAHKRRHPGSKNDDRTDTRHVSDSLSHRRTSTDRQ